MMPWPVLEVEEDPRDRLRHPQAATAIGTEEKTMEDVAITRCPTALDHQMNLRMEMEEEMTILRQCVTSVVVVTRQGIAHDRQRMDVDLGARAVTPTVILHLNVLVRHQFRIRND